MRRASGVRLSSPRSVCIFCATRQEAAFAPHIALSQRRQLNSSSRAPQYAAEAQVYREERPPSRPATQAERLRQQLMASARYAQPAASLPQPSMGQMSQAERQRAALGRSQQQQKWQPSQRPPTHSFGASGRSQSPNRWSSPPPQNRAPEARRDRYNVKMDSRPLIRESSQFGSWNLQRRDGPPPIRTVPFNAEQREQPRASTSVLRPKLDQEELDRLLGNASNTSQRDSTPSFASLSREPRTRFKCTNCGAEGHSSFSCPNRKQAMWKPRVSPQLEQAQRAPRTQGTLADAAHTWAQKEGKSSNESGVSQKVLYEEEQRTRRNADMSDRRRGRFRMEEEEIAPVETRNRYEEPERRKRGGNQRKTRNRVIRDEDYEEQDRHVSREERKRQRKEAKKAAHMAKAEPTPVVLPEYISVANLASILKLRVEDFVQKLEELGFEDVQNDHILNAEHAGLVAQEYNYEPIFEKGDEDRNLYPAPELSPEDYAQLPTRPPVVTIMGHVDHGKTTILDYIRSTQVAAGEFGGITQHIGAFSVPLASGKKITFLDTPGHAAFETMRARGANVTDIVVLVVAADDSVMPQTVEAIKHAQAARVPIIVAINKIDKQHADPERVKLDLGRHGLEVEDFGGDIQTVNVSGKTGRGISDLEEAISLQSEVLDHRADPHTKIEGWVLEGTTKKSGRVATVLVRSGTLRPGDVLVAGNTWARVRTLRNESGIAVKEVGPGMPVEVDGWREQPIAGDEVLQAENEQHAAEVSELRIEKLERERLAKDMEAINESRRHEAERREAEEAAAKAAENGEIVEAEAKEQESGPDIISFIVKGDVSGSVEAVIDSIASLGNNEVGTRILRHGVGPPSEFDVQHAADAKGHIVNFNTVIPPNIRSMAEEKGVRILDSNIIYRVVENVKAVLEEKLPPKITQHVTGEAEVAAVFAIGLGGKKKLKVAGSKVRNGVVEKGTRVKVLRGDEVVFDGILSSLKNQKKDVQQMRKDTECGISFEGWEDFQTGDKISCYEEKSERRTL